MGLTVTNLVFIGLVELDLKSNKAIIDKKKHPVKGAVDSSKSVSLYYQPLMIISVADLDIPA